MHIQQPFVGGFNLFHVFRIGGISQGFQRDHEGIAAGIVHIGMAFEGGIQEDLPAFFLNEFRIDLRGVVDDADALPEIGYGIGVVRVIGQVPHRLRQVVQVVNDGLVQGLEALFLDEPLDHIVAGHQDIPGIVAAEEPGIQRLVGVIVLVIDLAVVLLFKIPENGFLFINIGTPVEDVERSPLEVFGGLLRENGNHQGNQGEGKQYGNHFFHAVCSSFLFFLSFRTGIRLARMRMTATTTTIRADSALTAGLKRFMVYTYMEMFCTSMPAVK